jgi:pyridoxal phosphate enzyme (YggS family)
VTKYVSLEVVSSLVGAGCSDLGESRTQELWSKAAALSQRQLRWHMIGHLQRNKIRRTLPLVSLIHSVDSLRLIAALEEEASPASQRVPVLFEVNVSGEPNKHGFAPHEIRGVLEQAGDWPHLKVAGLMAMAGLEGTLDDARREFASLRALRDDLKGHLAESVSLEHLSMGMSGDYEVAIEEGATIVRVGSVLFENIRTQDR